MSVKLAILTALAGSPGRRATFDEIRRDVANIVAGDDQAAEAERFAALGDVDIFKSGFVVRDETGLQITDAGMSLLRWLEGTAPSEPLPPISPAVESLESIDDLIGTATRLKFFDLELSPRPRNGDLDDRVAAAPDRRSDVQADKVIGQEAAALNISPEHVAIRRSEPTPRGGAGAVADKARALLALCLAGATAAAAATAPARRRLLQGLGGAAIALLGVMVMIACLVAAIAYSQIEGLRSEIVALRRELAPAKERIAKLEQIEKGKRAFDRPSSLSERLTGVEIPAQTPQASKSELVLSREEIQVIRDFIKPAPTPGSPMPSISVGDPVGGPTIPIPSAVSEKVPKLIGAKFTIRNGSIIIVRSGSRHADAVLSQN